MDEVYGVTFIETGKDKLIAILTALISTMSTGYDPTISYVYEKHQTAKLLLNAVTIDMNASEDSDPNWSTDIHRRYFTEYTVRVHTGYTPDGITDGQKISRLINSLVNKFGDNLTLGDGYRIEDIINFENQQEYSESATFGGGFSVVVSIDVTHTQE